MQKESENPLSNTIGMHGKMGKVITLFRLYRDTGEEARKAEAEELLDAIMTEYSIHTSLNYGSGLCGMGAGIEYLIQNKFVEGDADEVLSELDQQVIYAINARPLSDLNIESGILGLACYMYSRLCYRKDSEEAIVLRLKEHTVYLIDWIADTMQNSSTDKNYYEIYFVLILFHQLNILNAKVERMMDACNKTIQTLKS